MDYISPCCAIFHVVIVQLEVSLIRAHECVMDVDYIVIVNLSCLGGYMNIGLVGGHASDGYKALVTGVRGKSPKEHQR